MKFVIDRFEENFAVAELENGTFENICRNLLPPDAAEGDIIVVSIDKKQTGNIKKRIENKMNSLFSD